MIKTTKDKKKELEYLKSRLSGIINPTLLTNVKKGIKNLNLMLSRNVHYCPYCSNEKTVDGSFQFIGYWIKLDLIKTEIRKQCYWECPKCLFTKEIK